MVHDSPDLRSWDDFTTELFSDNEHCYSSGSMKLFRYLSEWFICSSWGLGWMGWSLEVDGAFYRNILRLGRSRGCEFSPHLSPLPVPLLQVFLEYLLSFCSTSLLLLSVSSLFSSNPICQQTSQLHLKKSSFTSARKTLFSVFLIWNHQRAKSSVLRTVLVSLDRQEAFGRVSFLKLQHFKKQWR